MVFLGFTEPVEGLLRGDFERAKIVLDQKSFLVTTDARAMGRAGGLN
jgi:hypothetical protein